MSFHCSTSNVSFETEAELRAHYKSDFHRYNLKRKVAGLPAVTREWFDVRRARAAAAGGGGKGAADGHEHGTIWQCPLTRKKFASEAKWEEHKRTKKFAQLLKKSGATAAPAPTLIAKRPKEDAAAGASGVGGGASDVPMADADEEEDDDDDSGWETASDEDEDAMDEEWDVRMSLFDNHLSESLEANLEYMLKHFGFYIPDADYLVDPEGLMKYLGWKVAVAHLPLYKSGMEEGDVKTFRTKHATQQHMVDSCKCGMLFDDNEEEYEEYYDYSRAEMEEGADGGEDVAERSLTTTAGARPAVSLHEVTGELVLGRSGKVLGSRSMAHLYRQRHRPEDTRDVVRINEWHSRYRALLATNLGASIVPALQAKQEKRVREHRNKHNEYMVKPMAAKGKMNGNKNLLRNVPY